MIIEIKDLMTPEITRKLAHLSTKGAEILAWQILKDSTPYTPALTGSFKNRATVKGNVIIYPGPYARYLWFGNRMVNSKTGKGPRWIPNVGWRWPKGAVLKPTSDPLHYSTGMHAYATDHWVEAAASNKANMEKWTKMVVELIKNG